ncbi:glycosyltransferase [Vibrio sp. SCSIO 43140]|uniref:glycosyltransferase n=1 Tax=Vibrio sp. SCSIO 43140 TaxID=2819100 RepID=UPI002075F86C|nr:glycosyltransferase [Vibrio sp. SCSIO 43140]USD60299.1 glycosyltransferase [Vibrio sp. SCSIO 43140]
MATTQKSLQSIEVIITTYNNVRDMRIALEGYLRQTDSSFSLCIADDGSGPEIKALIEVYRALGLSIRHIWQVDDGYRRALILNKAIASSAADFIVMTDNDCIPSQYFIADYRRVMSYDSMFFGRRVDLPGGASQLIRDGKVSLASIEQSWWLLSQTLKGYLKRPEIAIRFPDFIVKYWNRKPRGAIGANLAVPREALLKVNGFDADYQGYGMEETDLVWRLEQFGLKIQTMLGRCALFHLYHPEKTQLDTATEMFEAKKKQKRIYCLNGIESMETQHND